MPDDPNTVLASMGNYIFETQFLFDVVRADSESRESKHDVGGNLIPRAVEMGEAHVYDFADNVVPGSLERDRGYWRDVGTLDAYFDAHMDLVDPEPVFNLYNDQWPVYTAGRTVAPAKIVSDMGNSGAVVDSILSNGVIVSGGTVRRSILSPGVHVEGDAIVENAILLDGVRIGPGAVVKHAIVDKNVVVPPKAEIGVDPDRDRARFDVSAAGVVAIGKEDAITEPR
jgi:glucose-1-phosphate adenylyltransferase